MDIPEIEEREELSEDEIAERINELHLGDRVLFNERQVPLRVTQLNADGRVSIGEDLSGIEIEGQSVQYILSPDEAMYHRRSGIVRRSVKWVQKIS